MGCRRGRRRARRARVRARARAVDDRRGGRPRPVSAFYPDRRRRGRAPRRRRRARGGSRRVALRAQRRRGRAAGRRRAPHRRRAGRARPRPRDAQDGEARARGRRDGHAPQTRLRQVQAGGDGRARDARTNPKRRVVIRVSKPDRDVSCCSSFVSAELTAIVDVNGSKSAGR